jgi:predicted glycogen debranching enzyme
VTGVQTCALPIFHNQPVYSQEAYLQTLDLAARDFLANDDLIAGYPWFGPWSRDTLISLGALRHLKGGPRQAVRILKKYGREIKGGLLPNVFGEGGRGTNYDSVDAPLWYVLRGHEFAPRDKELFGRCREIVLSFLFDPDPRVHVGDDGLIDIRPGEYALTWMDAKVYGQPVTPRWGKPVEINALWYNALMALLEMARAQGLEETDNLALRAAKINLMGLAELAREVRRSLQGFVVGDYLADRLTDQGPVTEIRPNAVVAAALPFDWLDRKTLVDVLKKAEEELLTSKGLRSLSLHAPGFKKKYLGNQKQRDLTYHQGTVWAWLLWPMAQLYLKVHQGKKNPEALARALTNFVWRFRSAFRRNHIASVAEIWDGLEPELPKGCPAQAWSTLALLQIEQVIKELEAKA